MDSERHDGSSSFARLGELARSVGTGKVPRAVDALGEHRAAEAFERSRKVPVRGRVLGLGVAVAMMASAVIVSSLRLTNAPSWTVEGSASNDAKYISPANDQEARVHFSDGTEFDVQPRSRLRIADAGKKVVNAVLETGASRVRISARSSVAWKIDVGPFSVSPSRVASLMVEWLADELLRVKVFEGESSVEGTPSPLFLHAGQQVSANAKNGTVEVGPLNVVRDVPANPPPEVRSSAPEQAPSPNGPSTALPSALPSALPVGGSSKRNSWPDAVAAGDYTDVLIEAERRGVVSVLADGTLPELVALGDAARLTGRIDLAKRALVAQRGRFPRSGAARDAAFFLGRLADDHEHATATAISWYEKYLSEAPNGAFSAEALGRRMVAVSRQSGRGAAKEFAAEYLKRFPEGPHARVARELSVE